MLPEEQGPGQRPLLAGWAVGVGLPTPGVLGLAGGPGLQHSPPPGAKQSPSGSSSQDYSCSQRQL
jgi:hypothetical protein